MRRFETRQLLGDGWTTEWEPETSIAPLDDAATAHLVVLDFNKKAKEKGSNVRMRSVEVDDE